MSAHRNTGTSVGASRSLMGSALLACACLAWLTGCEDLGKKSEAKAREHLDFMVRAAQEDVAQVRTGLPQGAEKLVEVFKSERPELPGPEAARKALRLAREKTQDLRVAKSTFFALLSPDGQVIRNDQEQDLMVGKPFFTSFPAVAKMGEATYLETVGSMPEAAGVRGRDDAQWVAASPVRADGQLFGYYVTGWSWSAYAYRLETGLRSNLLTNAKEGDKIPLLYVFVVRGDTVYGAPVSPQVNRDAVAAEKVSQHVKPGQPWTKVVEIDHRTFGLAAGAVSELGEQVALVVLRSET